MKNADFAAYACRLSKLSAEWADEALYYEKFREKEIATEAADRFIFKQRKILNYIERKTRNISFVQPAPGGTKG